MGKKRRLNRFISKWIKSDLPEDRTTVLLLGVTRIPTSPVPNRRPYSLPPSTLEKCDFIKESNTRRGSVSVSDNKRSIVIRRNSSVKKYTNGTGPATKRNQIPAINVHHVDVTPQVSVTSVKGCSECPLSEFPLSKGERTLDVDVDTVAATTTSSTGAAKCTKADVMSTFTAPDVMERSVDSIGTCSLDVDASVDFSDWSEPSSAGTLRSASVISPTPEPHLPSYLSLACTVNGYSTSTHYDPVRLASRSRDASPHRLDSDYLYNPRNTYSGQNNLLSPPNIVPLPTQKMENTLTQHRSDFYSSMKTTTYLSKRSFTGITSITKDATDSCLENGHHNIQNKCVSYESTTISTNNGQAKCLSETAMKKELINGQESTKSFIQQKVERLYGPGALAQGFFITKSPKSRPLSDFDGTTNLSVRSNNDKHSISLNDRLLEDNLEPSMKQSTSSPTLPVLRHLRPEFRAQLPAISPRKSQLEVGIQKSITIPKLKEEMKTKENTICEKKEVHLQLSNNNNKTGKVEKDGHYFLQILEDQTKRLLELATRVENEISNPDLSEEIIGILRSASGKARLLVTQKMQQFKGLCMNNINRTAGEQFPTTNEDLQGFWDMVMLQVDQVDALFKEIETLKSNGWSEPVKPEKPTNPSNGTVNTKTSKKTVNRPTARPISAVNEEARKKREDQRKKMLEDRRKAMKEANNQSNQPSIEIFVPEANTS